MAAEPTEPAFFPRNLTKKCDKLLHHIFSHVASGRKHLHWTSAKASIAGGFGVANSHIPTKYPSGRLDFGDVGYITFHHCSCFVTIYSLPVATKTEIRTGARSKWSSERRGALCKDQNRMGDDQQRCRECRDVIETKGVNLQDGDHPKHPKTNWPSNSSLQIYPTSRTPLTYRVYLEDLDQHQSTSKRRLMSEKKRLSAPVCVSSIDGKEGHLESYLLMDHSRWFFWLRSSSLNFGPPHV